MGAVSAADVNTSNNSVDSASSNELVLIEISGQVEQCSDGEPFPGATVTVHDNGTQVASTTTSADGTYTTSFQSMNRVFTVTASANGHKPSTQTVTANNNQETYTGTANLHLGNNDAYVYQGWTINPDENYTFSDGTIIHLTGASNAFTTINEGITYATGNPGVTVYIAPGTYNEYSMSIDTSVNLHGENQDTTIIDADDNARILTIWNGATVNIEQLTFRDGASEYGGALRVESGTTTITDCTFDSNTVNDYGGAIYMDPGATATISGSTFTDNTAVDGGAIYNDGGVLAFNGCTFTGNRASSANFGGGAILNSINGGTVSLSDCIFTSNTAEFAGGAIYNRYNLTVENSTFTSNTASSYGGAISGGRGNNTITGCTFNGNTAGYGGAIAVGAADTCTVKGCTFIGNSATMAGGAIFSNLIITANFNRFYSNQASQGSAISAPNSNIENNWWGSNNPIPNFPSLISGASAPTQWLFMTVSADPTTINNGGTSLITVSFNNYSSDGTTYTEFDPSLGHIPDGTQVTFATTLGSIPGTVVETAGGIATATFTANQTPGIAYISGLIDSYQTPYNPNNPNTTPYTTVTIIPAANLAITKTGPNTVIAGESLTYNITITNNGPDIAEGVTLQDVMVGADAFNTGTLQYRYQTNSGTWSTWISFSNPLNINLGTINNGNTAVIQIRGTVKSAANSGIQITNTATTDTTTTPGPKTATITTTVNRVSDMVLTKTVDKTKPNVGETVTYTVTAHNNGPSDATNIQINDIMPSGFSDVTITPSKGTYNNGIWTLDLASGETATLTLTGKVTATMAGKTANNTANIQGTTTSASSTIYVPKSDLYVTITSSKQNPGVGEKFILTYKLGNNGPDTAENVTITIPVPEGFVVDKIEGDGTWTYDPTTKTITWTMANVTVGDPYLYITGWFSRAGSYVFTASINSNTYNINTQGVSDLTVNAQNVAEAKTISMQETGAPIAPILLAILLVIGGLLLPSRK
ncbi:carboxypeptidase regulatory-like domain-containing protein [Methanobacterium sp.]|uniref:carboxypeptidase regulatory-like domain-containing protein n=1 Tax=Methanobacterium sp. TaxID=2164 RepID=UPI002ABBDB30|nr:carboxypeptidase regulatory-like domain-containing protein [Methanobacterium sp.]MDY9924364.1 carboxypeptidase regulatory-like domain-containing protein [Methanobacterium sp.]